MPRMNAHQIGEERSLRLHAEVARILAREPAALEGARERVRGWLRDGSVHPRYAERWAQLLAGPLEDLTRVLADRGEEARALRQVTPFAGLVDPRTRWRIWREVREGSPAP